MNIELLERGITAVNLMAEYKNLMDRMQKFAGKGVDRYDLVRRVSKIASDAVYESVAKTRKPGK